MFKSKKQHHVNPDTMDTLIGEGSIFEGKIKSKGGIRIEGHIVGEVESLGEVTVGERGSAKSNISARNVIVAGVVHGNINAKGTLKLMSTGQLFGNMTAQAIAIEEGAVFQGASRMETKEPAGEKQKKTETAPAAAFSPPQSPPAPAFHQDSNDTFASR